MTEAAFKVVKAQSRQLINIRLALKYREDFALKESSGKDSCASPNISMSHEYSWQGPVMLAEGHMVPALHSI